MKNNNLHARLTEEESTLLAKAIEKAEKETLTKFNKTSFIVWLIKKYLKKKTL